MPPARRNGLQGLERSRPARLRRVRHPRRRGARRAGATRRPDLEPAARPSSGRLEDVVATTGGTWADIDDVRAVGDEVLVSLTWRMERGDSATLAAVYHLVGVHGDRIARVRVFLDEDAAVQAAGG